MQNLNPGQTGAKRQSWEKYNPRDVLRDAIRSKPRGTEKEIHDIVWETIRNEKGYLPVIFDYWFTNNYRQFFVKEIEENSTAIMKVIRQKKNGSYKSNQPTRDEIEAAKARLRPILMDQTLSTGKPLRDSTFGECAQESGWLREVAKQGKPNTIVGRKLTEKDLWNLKTRATA